MVTAATVSDSSDVLLDPDAAAWRALAKTPVSLFATPLILQPSEYVQNKWKDLKHGQTKAVRVAAAHNRDSIFFRLEWDDPSQDTATGEMSDFPDQAGVMLPIKEDAVIEQMGSEDKPVNMWLWRAGLDTPLYVTATGRGTSTRHTDSPLSARGVWRDDVWAVVVGRPFAVNLPAENVVPLAPGMTHKCTFAVWQGANKERAGLKAYGAIWEPLEIES